MKKIVCAVLALVLLMATSALGESMLVHITAVCYDLNHVGTNWQGYFSIGDLQVFDGDIVDLDVAKYLIYSEIGEYDATPDIGCVENEFNVTQNRLLKGFTVEQMLTVAENQGMYRDYWTEWYVTYEFIPVGYAYVLNTTRAVY